MFRHITALTIASAAGTALAQDTFVVPDDFATLPAVLNPAVSGIEAGDIIVLRDTVDYIGNFVIEIPDLTIRAADGESPVLDGNGAGGVIDFRFVGGSLTLEGLTIQNGSSSGGGVFGEDADLLTVRDCTFLNNARFPNAQGGALFGRNIDVLVEDCVFENNTSDSGGGAMAFNGPAEVTVNNSQFAGNSATGAVGGGAIAFDVGSASSLTINDSTFTANDGRGRGGAAYIEGAGSVRIEGSTFAENFALNDDASDGGALVIERVGNVVIQGSDFERNITNDSGGAIFTLSANVETVLVTDTRFVGNESSDGGAMKTNGGDIEFINCEFIDNRADRNGFGTVLGRRPEVERAERQHPRGRGNLQHDLRG